MLVEKVKSIDISGLFNRDGNVDLTEVNFDNVLQDYFSNKVNKILETHDTLDLLSDKISIISYEYYVGTLEYLVYDEQDCLWISYRQLKADELLLVVEYISQNRDILLKYTFYLTTWAKGILEAKKGGIRHLKAVTTVKSKKGQIRKVKFRVTIPFNPEDIEEVD